MEIGPKYLVLQSARTRVVLHARLMIAQMEMLNLQHHGGSIGAYER